MEYFKIRQDIEDAFRQVLTIEVERNTFKKDLAPYKEKAWITFLDDDFEDKWQPLTLEVYGKEKHLDWHPRISMDIARSKYPDRKWGISYCEQKDMNNACRDNF